MAAGRRLGLSDGMAQHAKAKEIRGTTEPIMSLMRVFSVSTSVRQPRLELSPHSAVDVASTRDEQFHRFYRDEADGVYRALALALGDVELAQEAANEGMARAYQRWRKIGAYESPAGWVYRVGLNWGRSRIRKTGREVLTRERAESAADPTGASTSIDHEIDPDLRAALAKLSIDARAVVVLRYLMEWSTSDTAVALGVAEGTVKSRLARALAQLESLLEER